jgi:hypothetical protein
VENPVRLSQDPSLRIVRESRSLTGRATRCLSAATGFTDLGKLALAIACASAASFDPGEISIASSEPTD